MTRKYALCHAMVGARKYLTARDHAEPWQVARRVAQYLESRDGVFPLDEEHLPGSVFDFFNSHNVEVQSPSQDMGYTGETGAPKSRKRTTVSCFVSSQEQGLTTTFEQTESETRSSNKRVRIMDFPDHPVHADTTAQVDSLESPLVRRIFPPSRCL